MVEYAIVGDLDPKVVASAVSFLDALEVPLNEACVVFSLELDFIGIDVGNFPNAKVLFLVENGLLSGPAEAAIEHKIYEFVRKSGAVIVYESGESITPATILNAIEVYHDCQ